MEGFSVIDHLGREVAFAEHLERALVIARSLSNWNEVRRRSDGKVMAYPPGPRGSDYAELRREMEAKP